MPPATPTPASTTPAPGVPSPSPSGPSGATASSPLLSPAAASGAAAQHATPTATPNPTSTLTPTPTPQQHVAYSTPSASTPTPGGGQPHPPPHPPAQAQPTATPASGSTPAPQAPSGASTIAVFHEHLRNLQKGYLLHSNTLQALLREIDACSQLVEQEFDTREGESEEERAKLERLLGVRTRLRGEIEKKEVVVVGMIERLRQLQFDLSTLLANPKTDVSLMSSNSSSTSSGSNPLSSNLPTA